MSGVLDPAGPRRGRERWLHVVRDEAPAAAAPPPPGPPAPAPAPPPLHAPGSVATGRGHRAPTGLAGAASAGPGHRPASVRLPLLLLLAGTAAGTAAAVGADHLLAGLDGDPPLHLLLALALPFWDGLPARLGPAARRAGRGGARDRRGLAGAVRAAPGAVVAGGGVVRRSPVPWSAPRTCCSPPGGTAVRWAGEGLRRLHRRPAAGLRRPRRRSCSCSACAASRWCWPRCCSASRCRTCCWPAPGPPSSPTWSDGSPSAAPAARTSGPGCAGTTSRGLTAPPEPGRGCVFTLRVGIRRPRPPHPGRDSMTNPGPPGEDERPLAGPDTGMGLPESGTQHATSTDFALPMDGPAEPADRPAADRPRRPRGRRRRRTTSRWPTTSPTFDRARPLRRAGRLDGWRRRPAGEGEGLRRRAAGGLPRRRAGRRLAGRQAARLVRRRRRRGRGLRWRT